MQRPFTRVAFVANPESTNDSVGIADRLAGDLRRGGLTDVRIHQTKRAGHAAEIAKALLEEVPTTLLASVSGDGGYHEMVNGALNSGVAEPMCTVFAAGNANDHDADLHEGDNDHREQEQRILQGEPQRLDVLRFDWNEHDQQRAVYAHSYGGWGLSAKGAAAVNKLRSDNPISELSMVVRLLREAAPVQVRFRGRTHHYDAVLCMNVGQMAKYLKSADASSTEDGRFELILVPNQNTFLRFATVARAAVSGLQARRTESARFELLEPSTLQIDGEVYELPVTEATVSVRPAALRTF